MHISVNREFRLVFDGGYGNDSASLTDEEVEQLVKIIARIRGVAFVEPIRRHKEVDSGGGDFGVLWEPKASTVGDLRRSIADLSDDTPLEIEAYQERPEFRLEGPLKLYELRPLVSGDRGKDAPMKFVMCISKYVGVP